MHITTRNAGESKKEQRTLTLKVSLAPAAVHRVCGLYLFPIYSEVVQFFPMLYLSVQSEYYTFYSVCPYICCRYNLRFHRGQIGGGKHWGYFLLLHFLFAPPSFCGACLGFVASGVQPSLPLVNGANVEVCYP